MTALRTYANLWTLWDHPGSGSAEWPLARKVAAIAGAGFDGVMGEPGQGIGALATKHGLSFVAFSRLHELRDFRAVLSRCREENGVVLQTHLGWHDTTIDAALDLALHLDAVSREIGVEAVIETHRDTCTETPEKTATLRRRFCEATNGRELPLLLDFSHHAVIKHLDPPFAARLLAEPEQVSRTRWHHLRPFNGHHAQIPVASHDGSNTPEMADWLAFAGEILRLLRNGPLGEVWICPEIGPVRGGYGLSAFPPSWQQAVALNGILKQHWEKTP
jgi:16S rRNA G966 N2-methylase RsmD